MVSVQVKKAPYNLSTNVDAKGKLISNNEIVFPSHFQTFKSPSLKPQYSINYQHSFCLTKFVAELRKNAVLSDR